MLDQHLVLEESTHLHLSIHYDANATYQEEL